LTLLSYGKRCQENEYDSILAEGEAVVGMTSYLKKELSVAPFEHKLTCRWPPDGQATKNEWSRTESQVLVSGLPPKTYEFDAVELVEDLLRNGEPAALNRSQRRVRLGMLANGHTGTVRF
jgi:hypothetical protein